MARTRGLGAIVLAAGRSVRFGGRSAKVLHPLCGKPLLAHVLDALRELHRTHRLREVVVVVPPGREVERALGGVRTPFRLHFAVQRRPKGTAIAAEAGLRRLTSPDEVLVLAGDAPLVAPESLRELVDVRRKSGAALALLTATFDRPPPYGRIVRSDDGSITAVVEERDATAGELAINEVNASTYCFEVSALRSVLPKVGADNAQGERYLTDVVALLARSGQAIASVEGRPEDVLGVNTRSELARLVEVVRRRVIERLLARGVTVLDPESTYVDADVEVGADTVVYPGTYLEGRTRVGERVRLGPFVHLVDTTVGDEATITFSAARGARIGPRVEVGPFASLRPGTVLRAGSKAGTFVEMKEAVIGERTKVPHLSYMGDVRVGRDTNVGAGTITANYNPFALAPDGGTKHRTTIGDGVYVGSDTTFVAPVRIGKGAQTGAGSVVTRNVGAGRLVFGVPARERGPAKARPDRAGAGRTRQAEEGRTAGETARRRRGATKKAAKMGTKTTRKRKGRG